MSVEQDGCEWVNVSSGTGPPGSPGQRTVTRCVCACYLLTVRWYGTEWTGKVMCDCVQVRRRRRVEVAGTCRLLPVTWCWLLGDGVQQQQLVPCR